MNQMNEELEKLSNPFDKLDYLLAMTHYSYEDGCDAWVAMTKLFPELKAEYEKTLEEVNLTWLETVVGLILGLLIGTALIFVFGCYLSHN